MHRRWRPTGRTRLQRRTERRWGSAGRPPREAGFRERGSGWETADRRPQTSGCSRFPRWRDTSPRPSSSSLCKYADRWARIPGAICFPVRGKTVIHQNTVNRTAPIRTSSHTVPPVRTADRRALHGPRPARLSAVWSFRLDLPWIEMRLVTLPPAVRAGTQHGRQPGATWAKR